MNFLELANREARKRVEADPNVAVVLVGPDDRFALSDMMREDGRLEIVHRENFGIDEREAVFVKCDGQSRGWRRRGVRTCRSGVGCRRGRPKAKPRTVAPFR